MHTIKINYIPSEWVLFGGTFDCQHLETHNEPTIGAYWSEQLETSIDTSGTVEVCDDCEEVIEQDCE